jgi:hypothetical protein
MGDSIWKLRGKDRPLANDFVGDKAFEDRIDNEPSPTVY